MIKDFLENNKDLALVLGMILILVVLFSPIPAVILDLAIIINFGFGLTILLLTFYVAKPVEFSTFPSLLLITTLFRLSLNVAATRLILTGGDAGQVINSIGTFAVSGNFIVGFVVFSILIVVQYVVVTSGAQRVSEVAARFTLDSMPGQQMSIDADLNMGMIDQKEAMRRRKDLEKEASFYGSMDGASKFVKGDAIAGIIILLIDIIAGWIIGVVQMGMSWGQALEHFSLLTIGDGIATQLPALVIAVATGIIVTRSSSDRELSIEVFKQLSSVPRIPLIVAGILCFLMLMPGMPKWPILILVSFSLFMWFRIRRQNKLTDTRDAETDELGEEQSLTKSFPVLEIMLGNELMEAWKSQDAIIMDRISSLRDSHEKKMGLGFPALKLKNGSYLRDFEYEIKLFGTRYAQGEIRPDKMLAVKGEKVTKDLEGTPANDPAFGLPAIWIDEADSEKAKAFHYTIVDPVTVLITHLGEVMYREADTMLTRATVVRLLEEVRSRQGGLVEELIPNILSISDVQRIFQNLLSEGVSVANIDIIVEHLVDVARTEKDVNMITEMIRQRLSHAICHGLRERHADLAVISLDPRIENQILTSVRSGSDAANSVLIEPRLAQNLMTQLVQMSAKMQSQGRNPVLLCDASIRRQMKALTTRSVPKLSVVAVTEIPTNINLTSFDVVKSEA